MRINFFLNLIKKKLLLLVFYFKTAQKLDLHILNILKGIFGVWLKNTQDLEKITQKEMKNTQNKKY
jgi:hypothetical protein